MVHQLCTVISVMGPFNSPVGPVSRDLSLRFMNKQQTRSVGRGRGWERYVWRLVDSDIGTLKFFFFLRRLTDLHTAVGVLVCLLRSLC